MSPDDLISAFTELAEIDPELRIERTKVGDLDEVRLAPGRDASAMRRFEALSTDAVALLAPGQHEDVQALWLRIVWKQAPELIESDLRAGAYAEVDGKRVKMVAERIPNAAQASALVVRRLSDAQRRRDERTPPPVHPVDPSVRKAAQEHCPTLDSALIWLSRQSDLRPVAFALTWVHGRCTWSSPRNGGELWDYVGQLARGEIVDGEVREMVVPALTRFDTQEQRDALWIELLSRFPQVGVELTGGRSSAASGEDDEFRSGQWFTLNTSIPTSRLRHAANPKRKSKRVRRKVIDGVECYSVVDARQWWPSDMSRP